MRFATHYGAYIVEPFPSQPQIAVCHGLFVKSELRGRGLGHVLKSHQMTILEKNNYDYGICTIAGDNHAQQKVVASIGWKKLDEFKNDRTGHTTQIWGRPV